MNAKRLRFIAEYAVDGNASAAARRAGYSPQSARVNGPRLLRNAAVRDALARNRQETARKCELDRVRVLAGLIEAIDVARVERNAAAMVRGWSEIARICGFYAPERTVNLHVNVAMKGVITDLETRSDAELVAIVAGAALM